MGESAGERAQQEGQDDHKGHDHNKGSQEAKQVTVTGELIDTACFITSEGDAKGYGDVETVVIGAWPGATLVDG